MSKYILVKVQSDHYKGRQLWAGRSEGYTGFLPRAQRFDKDSHEVKRCFAEEGKDLQHSKALLVSDVEKDSELRKKYGIKLDITERDIIWRTASLYDKTKSAFYQRFGQNLNTHYEMSIELETGEYMNISMAHHREQWHLADMNSNDLFLKEVEVYNSTPELIERINKLFPEIEINFEEKLVIK